MKLVVLVLLLSFTVGFFFLAYFQNESRRGGYAMLAGFIILLLSGTFVAVFGLDYRDGYVMTDSGAVDTIDYTFVSLTATENILVSLPLIISGLWGLIVVGLALRETRYDEEIDE